MSELAQGRFFKDYGASLDAALATKAADIEPHLVPGVIVDRGCGTGSLMNYLAAKNRKVVGIEISDELSRNRAGVIQADVCAQVFADGFVPNIVLSSVLHEIFSYHGYSTDAVMTCLESCKNELSGDGHLIIRDVWSPEPSDREYELTFAPDTWEHFLDFVNRFAGKTKVLQRNEANRTARLDEATAVEFLSKKEYLQHWDLELREVYCALPIRWLEDAANKLGMKVLVAKPIANEWIRTSRWLQGVETKGRPLPPYTNQLVVLSKN
jgi:SAM-dependent methyltransferase